MRLLLVTHYYSTHRGGVEAVARELAGRLVHRLQGLEIEWIASDCDPCPEGLPAGVQCRPARSWNGLERTLGIAYPLWSPAAIAALWRAVGRCDALHLHESIYMGNVLAWLFARFRRKPVLVTQHVGAIPYSPVARGLLAAMNRTVARLVLCGADRVLFISPAVQRYFERFCRFRAAPACVPNGVDTELFAFADHARARALRASSGRNGGRPLFLFVGRFVPRKGIGLLLELAREMPQADWILAGDGPLLPEAQAPANLSVVRGRAGQDIAELYRMADLLVLPSKGEGFPLVVQEAMACGTPALVAPETADGSPAARAHLLTEPVLGEDAPGRWRRRLEALASDVEGMRRTRGDVARFAREHWSWEVAARAYAHAVEELGATSRSSASAAP